MKGLSFSLTLNNYRQFPHFFNDSFINQSYLLLVCSQMLIFHADQTLRFSKDEGKVKYFFTSSSVTSKMLLWDQKAFAPFSTNTVLTPSAKLGSTMQCWTSLQSLRKHSRQDFPLAVSTRWWITPTEGGHWSLRALVVLMLNSSVCPDTFLQISLKSLMPNSSLISFSWARVVFPEDSWYLLRTSVTVFLGLVEDGRTVLSSSKTASKFFLWMQQLAIPEIYISSPLSLAPVIPKQNPMLFLSRAKEQQAQMSVKNPNLASGMANMVFSVAILKGAMEVIPYPPPITIPSQTAICCDFSWASKQSFENYSLKKVSRSSTVASLENRSLTSPPAQKDLPPAPSNHTALVLSKLGISFLRVRIISTLRELRALGLLSTTFVKESNSWKSMLPTVLVEKQAAKVALVPRVLPQYLIIFKIITQKT